MTDKPVAYMMYLLYFRSDRCYSYFSWYNLGVWATNLPDSGYLPSETAAAVRTFGLALTYLVINGLLLITSIVLLCKFELDIGLEFSY